MELKLGHLMWLTLFSVDRAHDMFNSSAVRSASKPKTWTAKVSKTKSPVFDPSPTSTFFLHELYSSSYIT